MPCRCRLRGSGLLLLAEQSHRKCEAGGVSGGGIVDTDNSACLLKADIKVAIRTQRRRIRTAQGNGGCTRGAVLRKRASGGSALKTAAGDIAGHGEQRGQIQ